MRNLVDSVLLGRIKSRYNLTEKEPFKPEIFNELGTVKLNDEEDIRKAGRITVVLPPPPNPGFGFGFRPYNSHPHVPRVMQESWV